MTGKGWRRLGLNASCNRVARMQPWQISYMASSCKQVNSRADVRDVIT